MEHKQLLMLHIKTMDHRIPEMLSIAMQIFFAHLCCIEAVHRGTQHIDVFIQQRDQIGIELLYTLSLLIKGIPPCPMPNISMN